MAEIDTDNSLRRYKCTRLVLPRKLGAIPASQEFRFNQLNFIYGMNGTGKTSLSRFISENKELFADESQDVERFDSDTIRGYITNTMPGVYILGETSESVRKRIEDLEKELEKTENKKNTIVTGIAGLEKTLGNLREDIDDIAWGAKSFLDSSFTFKSFEGYRTHDKLTDAVINYMVNGYDGKYDGHLMKLLTESVRDGKNARPLEKISPITARELATFDNFGLFSEPLVSVAAGKLKTFYEKLNNTGWAREGISHMHNNGERCPFCNSALDMEFLTEIEKLGDELYNARKGQLESFLKNYGEYISGVKSDVRTIAENLPTQVDCSNLRTRIESLNERIDMAEIALESRSNNLSVPGKTELIDIEKDLAGLNSYIGEVNTAVEGYNLCIANISDSKKKLNNMQFLYAAEKVLEKKPDFLKNYNQTNKEITFSRMELGAVDNSMKEAIEEIRRESMEIRDDNTIVNNINNILDNFGFKTFTLVKTGDGKGYTIERPEGDGNGNSFHTLSEGEQKLLSFLYFFFKLGGSDNPEGVVRNKVVVIDDPLSTLDMESSHIVASLIKNMYHDMKNKKNNVVQMFLFTHDYSFLKQIGYVNTGTEPIQYYYEFKRSSFDGGALTEVIGPKTDDNDILNPIQGYWKDYFQNENLSPFLRLNLMRHIMEFYFIDILGNNTLRKVRLPKDMKDKYHLLVDVVHEASHAQLSSRYRDISEENMKTYKDIFEKTFKTLDMFGIFYAMRVKYDKELNSKVNGLNN